MCGGELFIYGYACSEAVTLAPFPLNWIQIIHVTGSCKPHYSTLPRSSYWPLELISNSSYANFTVFVPKCTYKQNCFFSPSWKQIKKIPNRCMRLYDTLLTSHYWPSQLNSNSNYANFTVFVPTCSFMENWPHVSRFQKYLKFFIEIKAPS